MILFKLKEVKGSDIMTTEQALKIIKEQIIYSSLKIRKELNDDSK